MRGAALGLAAMGVASLTPKIYEVQKRVSGQLDYSRSIVKKKEWGIVMDNDRINKMLNSIPRKTREEFLLILRDLSKSEGSSEPSRESQERAQLKV